MSNELKELAKELQDIGLSEKESKVYLALLELGQETVQNISKKANVNRATTYVVLESLQKKGIVTTFEQNKKTFFIAEGPSALYNIIREQQEELEKKDDDLDGMMNELMTVYNLHPDKPKINFYEGKEGLKEMQKDFLNSGENDAVEFFSLSDVNATFTKEEAKEVGRIRREKNIKITMLFTDDSSDFDSNIKVYEDDLTNSLELQSDEYPFASDIIVYGDKVWMASLKGDLSGTIIQSKEIAACIKAIFTLSFEGAKQKI